MNRRGFLGAISAGAAAVAGSLVLSQEQAEALPAPSLAQVVPPTLAPSGDGIAAPSVTRSRHFAVLMNYRGVVVKTFMVDDLPFDIKMDCKDGLQRTFRLVGEGRYDGRTVEGLARYILWKGPEASWPEVKLGF